ncbi:hypothetical protein [Brachybacterium sp. FME24]|uniref:hypothetical protein n=1 Tax=Brachybacterium sp. FME24 TaxID=2742605 RepID=UPI0018661A4E|nr:hypothetical protein [Brachybacterium sp. FME24]
MHTYRIVKLTAAALAAPLLLVALTACGTTGDSPDADSSAGGPAATDQSFEQWELEYASCLREQGVDLPDPGPDGGIQPPSDDGFMEASEACVEELGDPPARPGGEPEESDEERQAAMLMLAACFRDHGVDVPDPKPGELVTIPDDAPEEVLEECASNGSGGVSHGGLSGDN